MNMSFFRLASLLLTAAAVFALPNSEIFRNTVYCFGYAHYILAVFYSKKQIRSVMNQPNNLLQTIGVLAAGIAVFFFVDGFLPALFSLHVALEEAYLSDKNPRFPAGSLSVLICLLYFVLFRHTGPLQFVDPRLLFIAVAGAAAYFGFCLYQVRGSVTPQEVLGRSVPALALSAAAGLSLFYPITFIQIALYHFVFWILYPSAKMPGPRFPALMAGAVGIAFVFSPFGLFPVPMDGSLFHKGFLLLSYLHISYSFIISNAQPAWLVQLFKPSFKTQGTVDENAVVS